MVVIFKRSFQSSFYHYLENFQKNSRSKFGHDNEFRIENKKFRNLRILCFSSELICCNMFQFVSKSRTWIWRKLQKNVQIYSERFKTEKWYFSLKIRYFEFKFVWFFLNGLFWQKMIEIRLILGKNWQKHEIREKCFSHFRFVIWTWKSH